MQVVIMCREHFDFVLSSLQLDRRRRSFVGSPVTTDLIKLVFVDVSYAVNCYDDLVNWSFSKTQLGVNVPRGRSNRCAMFLAQTFEGQGQG